MSNEVTEPRLVQQDGIPGELLRGKWCLYPHEWLGDDCDLDTWKRQVLARAEVLELEVCFFDIPRKDMTLVANADALPTLDQVAESVAALEQVRFLGRGGGLPMLRSGSLTT